MSHLTNILNKIQRNILKNQTDSHSAKESKKWLVGPDFSYWPQQLNFAVWYASTGCGVGREIFDKDHLTLGLPPNVCNFYRLHVYFADRGIFFQMGGIQSISSLPGDPTFNQYNKKYETRQVIFVSHVGQITVF